MDIIHLPRKILDRTGACQPLFCNRPLSGSAGGGVLPKWGIDSGPVFLYSFPMLKMSDREFSRIAGRVLDRIPDAIMEHVRNVAVMIEDWPDPELLEAMGLPEDEPLLGVYTGASLTERSFTWPEPYPDTIILFKGPLLDMCRNRKELEEEIEITIVHEIAHYFGISEERLIELGYG